MKFRTDMQFKNGNLAVRDNDRADSAHPLPELTLPDTLGSDQWAQSFRNKLAPYSLDNDSELFSALGVQERMAKKTQKLAIARNNQHPDEKQAVHLRKVHDEYERSQHLFAREVEAARGKLRVRLTTAQGEFEKALKFDASEATGIQAALRNMDPEIQQKEIQDQIERGDGRGLAAILKGHHLTMGISYDQQQALRTQAMQKHRPDLLALENEVKRADELLSKSFDDFLLISDTLTAKEVREKYEVQAKKAEEARSGF